MIAIDGLNLIRSEMSSLSTVARTLFNLRFSLMDARGKIIFDFFSTRRLVSYNSKRNGSLEPSKYFSFGVWTSSSDH